MRIEVEKDGKIVIIAGKPEQAAEPNPWDEVIKDLQKPGEWDRL